MVPPITVLDLCMVPSSPCNAIPGGRFAVFYSEAADLVPGDTNGNIDVFVNDRLTGETSRVSVDSAGNQGDRRSVGGSIAPGGQFVTFYSEATNLVSGDSNGKMDAETASEARSQRITHRFEFFGPDRAGKILRLSKESL